MAGSRGYVQTVRGRIDPAEVGRTLMHEHLDQILVHNPRRLREITGAY